MRTSRLLIAGLVVLLLPACRTFGPPPWGGGPPPAQKCTQPDTRLQEMLSLSFISYLGDEEIAGDRTIDDRLAACFESVLGDPEASKGLWGDGWSLVWGPEVSRLPWAIETDNLLYAVERMKEGSRQLAIVIRGTNPIGALDWLEEDLEVHRLESWHEVTGIRSCPATAQVSRGTKIGFDALRGLRNDLSIDMRAFLAAWCTSNKGQDLEVFVTGHSLGGALTPVFALWLAEENWLRDNATCGDAELQAYSFAAPTPGNAVFARCVDEELAKVGGRLHRIHNPLDIPPYAWTTEGLKTIPYLYEPSISAEDVDWALVDWALDQTRHHDYAHSDGSAPPLCTSTLFCGGGTTPCPPGEPTESLFGEAGWQHHFGYLYGLDLLPASSLGRADPPCRFSFEGEWCEENLATIFCLMREPPP